MTLHRFRIPDSALQRACPAYRDEIAAVERGKLRGDFAALEAAWRRADLASEAFGQGAEFARKVGAT